MLKLFTRDGQIQVYRTCPKVRLDGESVKPEEVYRAVSNSGSTVPQLIRYLLRDGLVAGVDLAQAAGQEEFGRQELGENTLRRYEFASQSFTFLTGSGVMFPYFNINNTAVFVIPADLSCEEDYKIKDRSYFIGRDYAAVSYTHLTLPTNSLV